MPNRTLTPAKTQIAFNTKSGVDTGQLLNRDGWLCAYCGRWLSLNAMTVDHIQPSKRGGPDELENTVVCCQSCNTRKGDMNGLEYRHWLAVRRYAFVLAPDELITYEPVEIVAGKGRKQTSTVIALPALWSGSAFLWETYACIWETNGGINVRMTRQGEQIDIMFLGGVLYEYYALKKSL